MSSPIPDARFLTPYGIFQRAPSDWQPVGPIISDPLVLRQQHLAGITPPPQPKYRIRSHAVVMPMRGDDYRACPLGPIVQYAWIGPGDLYGADMEIRKCDADGILTADAAAYLSLPQDMESYVWKVIYVGPDLAEVTRA